MLPLLPGDRPMHTAKVLGLHPCLPACLQTSSTTKREETKARTTHFSTQRTPIRQICRNDVMQSPSFPFFKSFVRMYELPSTHTSTGTSSRRSI